MKNKVNKRFLSLAAIILALPQEDPKGIFMSVTAMMIVFLGLALLFLVFKIIGKSAIALSRKRATKAAAKQYKYNKPSITASGEESGEICAAIIYALNDFLKHEHDIESAVLTIEKVARAYSPWSSKIYGLKEIPAKK